MAMEIIVKECGGMTLLGKRKRIGRGSRECTDDERVKPELIQPSLLARERPQSCTKQHHTDTPSIWYLSRNVHHKD